MSACIVEASGLSRTFERRGSEPVTVLREATLEVMAGEIVCIQGRSGSGKSTLLNILGLLDRSTSGRLKIGDQDVAGMSDDRLSALRGTYLGFVFQQFYLVVGKTARENVAEPLLFGTDPERRGRHRRAEHLLQLVGLEHRTHEKPNILSGGEQQRVAIARALARGPKLLLADEPTGALDTQTGDQVMDLLVSLVRQEGTSLVLVTHDDEIAARADRRFRIHDGTLVST
ncbi:MAG: ABC transporter ATP-binding protein [Thermomicrobiales bacterium]|nr:ABC transporter ATP-binding protein [Thermomicrobiales bacterium]MCO5218562.1 ABC transporter ATP-binding protein [Thermomicrobiales bacterium]MCO5226471.1 ABC transporter ATP-binding protein [Thermomicrobiales bacterium]